MKKWAMVVRNFIFIMVSSIIKALHTIGNTLSTWFEHASNNIMEEVKVLKNKLTVYRKKKANNLHQYFSGNGISDEQDVAAVLTPILILVFMLMISFVIVVPVMLFYGHSVHDIIKNIAFINFTVPAIIVTLTFILFGILPVPDVFYQLYELVRFSGLKKNSHIVYKVQCKLFWIFAALSISTLMGYGLFKVDSNQIFEGIYMMLRTVFIKIWKIWLFIMCIDGIILFCHSIVVIVLENMKLKKTGKFHQPKRLKPAKKLFQFRQDQKGFNPQYRVLYFKPRYEPKRLDKRYASLKRKNVS